MARFGRGRAEVLASSAVPGRKIDGLTAASFSIPLADGDTPDNRREAAAQKKRPTNWQRDAWRYYDDLSEVRAGARWMGDAQSRIRMFPAILADDPDQPPTPAGEAEGISPSEVAAAYDAIDRLQSDEGDRAELQRVFGLNLFIAGEVWLVGTDEQPAFATRSNPTGERWRAFSVEEMTVDDRGRWGIRPHENPKPDELELLDPETSKIIRIYRRHGRWRLWPDSAMRPANLIAEELLLQTQAIMGSLRSRLPAGIMPIPDDIEVVPDDDDEEDGANDGMDPILRTLIDHFSTPLTDPRNAAALVPYLMKLPIDVIKAMPPQGIWEVARSIDPEQGLRIDQLIHRLAIAFDMPPELLIGKGDINHWNAWEIDEDGVRLHVEPYTSLYCQGLTAQYFQPRLELAGVTDPERWVIWWDPTDVMSHPDQKQNALDGYNAVPPLVSGHVTRRALGFADDDAPDDAELATIMDWRSTAPAASEPFGNSKAPPPGEQHITGGALPFDLDVVAEAETILASATRPRRIGPALARIEERLHRDLLVAADAAVGRVVEKAQARIRSAAQRDKPSRAFASSTPDNTALAVALGPDQVRALGLDDTALFGGGFDKVSGQFATWTCAARAAAMNALTSLGVNPPPELAAAFEDCTSEPAATATANGQAVLVAGLTAVASSLLFGTVGTPTTGPPLGLGEWDPSFQVPAGLIRDALSEAGGGPSKFGNDAAAGFLAGAGMSDVLDGTPGFTLDGFTWAVGGPTQPFEPHQDLDGAHIENANDDQLAWDPGDFPYVSVLWPGDHTGCQCVLVPDGEALEAIPVDVPDE